MKNVLFLSLLCFALLSAGCKPTQPPSPCACTDPSTCTHPHNADGSCTCGSPTCKCNDGPQDTVPYQLKLVSTKVGDPITEEEYKSYTTLPQGVEEYYHHTGSEGVITELVEFVPVGNETLLSGDGNSAPTIPGSDDNSNDVKSGYIVTALDKATKGTEKADDAIGKLDPMVENADKKYTDGAAASAKKDRDALDVYRDGDTTHNHIAIPDDMDGGDFCILSDDTGYKDAYAAALADGKKDGEKDGAAKGTEEGITAADAYKDGETPPQKSKMPKWSTLTVNGESKAVSIGYNSYDGADITVQNGGVYKGTGSDRTGVLKEDYANIEVLYTVGGNEKYSSFGKADPAILKLMGKSLGYAQAYCHYYEIAFEEAYNAELNKDDGTK